MCAHKHFGKKKRTLLKNQECRKTVNALNTSLFQLLEFSKGFSFQA